MYKKLFILRNDGSLDNVKRGLYFEIKNLTLEKPIQVTLSEYKENKTAEQRSGFHVLCRHFGSELGYTEDDIKEIVKREALGVKIVTISGVDYEVTRSSESIKKDEYSHLIETVYRLAAENGIQLPALFR